MVGIVNRRVTTSMGAFLGCPPGWRDHSVRLRPGPIRAELIGADFGSHSADAVSCSVARVSRPDDRWSDLADRADESNRRRAPQWEPL